METKPRADPDQLLASMREDDRTRGRGRLKIFLGYAAGVGKTFAMLEEAKQRSADGIDVVAGFVETHGRAETEALLAGMEIVPRQEVEYRGVCLAEMDVDAILARRPQLVLVDELAHTNASGSRHSKRYVDVEELLAAGIDVFTTLNIQHLESLNDVVAQVTGITVRERVPDRLLDEASDIVLIDLPPIELLQRLAEGKVYVPDQAALATQRFFRLGNLNALREMAMRRAAVRVDEQMRAYMQARSIPGPWPAGERVLVCIGSSAQAERLIRSARRLAEQIDARWFVLHIETPGESDLSQADRDRLARHFELVEELGGTAVVLPGRDVAATVLQYARQHNITKVIIGKPVGARPFEHLRSHFVDELVRLSGHIDVYVISHELDAGPTWRAPRWRARRPVNHYLGSVALVIAATLLGEPIQRIVAPINLVMTYLVAEVLTAIWFGRGPSILSAALSVLAFDFFFVPPRYTFAVADTEYIITFAGLFIVGVVISTLAARAREQAGAAQARAIQTTALYELSRDLALAGDLETTMGVVIRHVGEISGCSAAVILPGIDALKVAAASPDLVLDEREIAVASWTHRHGRPAGLGTETLPTAKLHYLPLKTRRGVVAVLGIRPAGAGASLSHDENRLLSGLATQSALAIERVQLDQQAQATRLLQATEKLQSALLNSISHDLRTPLVSITGALTTLEADDEALDAMTRRNLVLVAREEADRLNRLVGNLLDMSRIEAGALHLHQEPADVEEVIGAALERVSAQLDGRPVHVDIPPSMPAVPMDFVLVVHVLVNLLDNAIKYSPAGSSIDIRCRLKADGAEFAVLDRGDGIPPEQLENIFDKFYRVKRPQATAGTGLGLAICRGILEAHDGRIWAENRPGGGAAIVFSIPMTDDAASGNAVSGTDSV